MTALLARLRSSPTLFAFVAFTLAQNPSAPFLDRLDIVVPGLLEKHQEAGIAIAFVDGCKASIRTYGVADRAKGTPVRPDTAFNVGSVSKTLTAWTVMTLVEAGRVKLDDPVDARLTRWHVPQSTFDRGGVTARRLLNHTPASPCRACRVSIAARKCRR